MVAAPPDRWQPTLDALGVARPGEIGWIHGGNTRTALSAALSDRRVHYIEGDISLVGNQIIMAHPPITESDLAFQTWLDMTIAAGKGAKLDFKSPDALAPCLNYARRRADGKIPLGVNADILPGPGGGPPDFDAAEFLRLCNEFLPQAYLSVGWTVGKGGDGYTKEMIATMLALLANADAAVSICLHAGYLHADWPRLKRILKETDYTFTVWGKVGDAALLSWIRAHTPPERCFYDMQNEDGSQIHMASI